MAVAHPLPRVTAGGILSSTRQPRYACESLRYTLSTQSHASWTQRQRHARRPPAAYTIALKAVGTCLRVRRLRAVSLCASPAAPPAATPAACAPCSTQLTRLSAPSRAR